MDIALDIVASMGIKRCSEWHYLCLKSMLTPGSSTICEDHHVSFHTCNKAVIQLISVFEDDVSVVECVFGNWPYGDHISGFLMKDLAL